jgi:ATP-dependent 26S proteasome regulatory subunit
VRRTIEPATFGHIINFPHVKLVELYWSLCTSFLLDVYFSDEKPDVGYSDIGGLDQQKQEVREAVELPLTHFELYQQIGIDPPRGVLLYGPPGCGKTMLAKAVAHHTTGRMKFF